MIPLFRVKRHIVAISKDQAWSVSPSCTRCASPDWPQLVQGLQEPGDERGALLAGAVFLQKQIAKALLESIDPAEDREPGPIGLEPGDLFGLEVVAVAPHQG
ncbi:MAG: hypothetical protein ACM3S5_12370, partial [Rhodospirillales bacterium]